MIYCEDIKTLELCFRIPYHIAIAKERRDAKGWFWSLFIVFANNPIALDKIKIHKRVRMVNADTYDELMIWCDMRDVKINSIERINDG